MRKNARSKPAQAYLQWTFVFSHLYPSIGKVLIIYERNEERFFFCYFAYRYKENDLIVHGLSLINTVTHIFYDHKMPIVMISFLQIHDFFFP